LDTFKVILFPFVEGHNGFESNLSDQQWIEFGAALKLVHTVKIPSAITSGIKREDFSPPWSEILKMFLIRIMQESFDDPVAVELAAFLKTESIETLNLVKRADRLAQILRERPPVYTLCDADIHV
jgi:spectinomycin phosphotransferase